MLQCSMIMHDDAHDQDFNCFLTSRMLQQELPSTKLEENVDEKVMYIVYMPIDQKKNNQAHIWVHLVLSKVTKRELDTCTSTSLVWK